MPDFETITFEVDEHHVATITLNRAPRLNSFNQPMLDEFGTAWARVRADDDIHAVVLRATGERAFSTGVDRKDGRFRHPNPWSEDDPGHFLGPKQNRVYKPVVTAVNGMAAGGAFYWINESDIVICSEDATFFDPHVNFGMVSALEPTGMLRRVPLGEVLRIALMGLAERVGAQRAREIGIVSEVVPADQLWARADHLARTIASYPPLAVQGTVKAIWDGASGHPSVTRETGLHYVQLGNPLAAAQGVEHTLGDPVDWELR